MAPEYAQKAALVTGGARGIGEATAGLLAERGYRVAIADRDVQPGRRSAARIGALFVRCDISRERDVRACLQQVLRRYARLDALVNNAGIADPHSGRPERLALADWNRRIAVNLTGAFLMAKHAAPHLRRARGAIVNIASTRALQSEPDTEAYAAAKGGLAALTHALAMSLGPAVRVNCISPGWIDTGKTKLSRADHAQHPVGRAGEPRDVAELAAFLLSEAAGFATGQNYVLDGGMTRKMIYL
jgi:NAD(P)-dependent dehydrogenase (short-subunit alcohol dehydrogenase family)